MGWDGGAAPQVDGVPAQRQEGGSGPGCCPTFLPQFPALYTVGKMPKDQQDPFLLSNSALRCPELVNDDKTAGPPRK